MNKKPSKQVKKPVLGDKHAKNTADMQKKTVSKPREEQRIVRPNGAPLPGEVRNSPNTARQSAVPQQKKRAPSKSVSKTSAKKSVKKPSKAPAKTPSRTSAKTPPQKTVSTGQPQAAKRPKPPAEKRPAAKAPQKPVVKSSARNRHKYHGGNYILYYMLAGVVVITVLVILANTVLFRCKNITVSGNFRYTAEEIAEQSRIELGKNLIHINARQAEENIVSSLAYIDAAKVKKSFPTGINITVTEAEKWFCIRQGNTTAAVSHGGKIVEHIAANGLTVFTGYEPESIDIGGWLRSKTEGKTNIPEIILGAIEKASLENVDEVELEDRFSIKMSIDDGRVILELGTISDMESKLIVANELIRNHIGATERVTVLLSNPEQPTVIPESIPEPEQPSNSDDSDSSDDPDDPSGQQA